MALSMAHFGLQHALAWTVIHAIWQLFIVALITGAVMIAIRKKKAETKFNVYGIALTLMMIFSVFTFVYYHNSSQSLNNSVISEEDDATANTEVVYSNSIIETPTSFMSDIQLKVYDYKYYIVLAWLIGMALSLLRLMSNIGYIHVLRSKMNFPVEEFWTEQLDALKARLGVQKGIQLFESALVRSPLVLGHLKPMILFPIGAINRLEVGEVEAILAHELAHIMRSDYFVNILIHLFESIYFFHPATWWLTSHMKDERENACDDVAVSICGSKIDYAKSLVAVQDMTYYSPQLAMSFANGQRKNQLLLRVNRLIAPPKINTSWKDISTAAVMICVAVLTIGMASKPIDDAIANCLPNAQALVVDRGNERFLKYHDAIQLDSLFLDFPAIDGTYVFADEVQNVRLTVTNNQVINFNINGLEVDGKDIPKFEKLIKQILTQKPLNLDPAPATSEVTIETTSNNSREMDGNGQMRIVTQHKDQKIVNNIDSDGIISMIIVSDDGSEITYEKHDDSLYKNGLEITDEDLARDGYEITALGIMPLDAEEMEVLTEEKIQSEKKYFEEILTIG